MIGLPFLGWWRDWRERRSALKYLRATQLAAEAVLMDQNLNPLAQAKAAAERGDVSVAVAYWDQARAITPDAVLRSPDALAVLLELERYDEADALMRERGKRVRRDRSHLTGLAKIAEQRGDFEEALKRWIVVRDRVSDTIDGYHGCARCLVALGRMDEAERQWEGALRRISENLEASVGRASISDRRKDWAESAKRWKHVAETFQYPPAFGSYATALAELGRMDEAEACLKEQAGIYPGDLDIAIVRTRLAQRRGDLTAACDRWAMVRAIRPDFSPGYYEGARRLFEADRHADADAIVQTAIDRFPDQSWPLLHFALLAHDRHDWNEAADRWNALRRRFPEESAGFTWGADALRAAGREEEAVALSKQS
jgi:tetratricopeptide (TPR) repeat protein